MQHLAPELLLRIFESLSSVSDIINLSLTCRYLHQILPRSNRLTLYYTAIDSTDGPVQDIIQLLTQNNNERLHVRRTPPLSLALLAQVMSVARVARRYVDLYPKFRWPDDQSMHRRFLDADEARRLRRAIYRTWGYVKAFHHSPNRLLCQDKIAAEERRQLLRTWSNSELFELEDFRGTLETLLATEICPTDGDVYARIPDESQKYRLSLQYPHLRPFSGATIPGFEDLFYSSRHSEHVSYAHAPSVQELRHRHMQGWGSDQQNFYLVQAFLKLSPAQILWLYDNAVRRADVEQYIESQTHDPCFFESMALLFTDWVAVLHSRGVDIQQAREKIWDGHAGIVIEARNEEEA
jgi:hypothetical protein